MNRYRLKVLWNFSKGSRGLFVVSLLIAFLTTAISFVWPKAQSFILDSVLGSEPIVAADWIVRLLDSIGGTSFLAANLWICALMLVSCNGLNSLLSYFRSRYTATASEGMALRMREALYGRLQRLPYDYHVKAETGDLIQRCTTDIETVRRFVSGDLVELFRIIAMFIVAAILLWRINPMMTVITLVLMPSIVIFSALHLKRIDKQFTITEQADGHLSTVMQENFTGVRVVRAFGREAFEEKKFSEANDDFRNQGIKLNYLFAFLWSVNDVLSYIPTLIVVILGITLAAKDQLTLGEFLVFVSYQGMMMWPIRSLGRMLGNMSKTLIATGRIDEILTQQEETSGENPQKPDLKGDIVFDDVTFSYGSNTVLKNLSFTIRHGQTVAILGSTGSGKSSLVSLLQRLYDYQSGHVTISGVELTNIDKDHLRSHVGIVLQEPFLYSRSIIDNIGITQDVRDEEAIYEAARVASVHDVIQSFDNGYNTVVGERGVTLSGGQKQRVAIARTILRENDILIFDDSLSAVDTQTDAAIRKALGQRRKGITTIIISHRISTLMEADHILVLEKGRITQQGTHEELIAQDGLYRKIWDIQNAVALAETAEEGV